MPQFSALINISKEFDDEIVEAMLLNNEDNSVIFKWNKIVLNSNNGLQFEELMSVPTLDVGNNQVEILFFLNK